MEGFVFDFPVTTNASLDGVVMPFGPGDALAEFGFHGDLFEAGTIRLDAEHAAEHPLTTGTE